MHKFFVVALAAIMTMGLNPAKAKQEITDAQIREGIALCETGGAEMCFLLAYGFETGEGVGREDHTLSKRLYELGCNNGSVKSCFNLANNLGSGRFSTGDAVKDFNRALALYESACNSNHAGACMNRAYITSRIANTRDQAAVSFEKACQLGVAKGCFEAGVLYANGVADPHGQGGKVAVNKAKAAALFRKACAGGIKEACG